MHVTAIIAAGGSGRRVGAAVPKQLLALGGVPMLQRTIDAFLRHPRVSEIIVAVPPQLAADPPSWLGSVRVVVGGDTRQTSVARAFAVVSHHSDIVLVHDAARPFVDADVIDRTIEAADRFGAAIAAVPASDTVKRVRPANDAIAETIPREEIYLAQTPQGFRRKVLGDAVALGRAGVEATDEAALAERAGYTVRIVAGDPSNVKITTAADIESARQRLADGGGATHRVGTGYDLHRLVEGRPLIIAGVAVPFDRGALGHSDADVACHAVTDALLGAARAGDIGQLFPDSDERWKGASSTELLRHAVGLVRGQGWIVENVDVIVVLERPKLAPYRDRMAAHLAAALGTPIAAVSIKGKSNEGVDAVGRGEAIAAHAVVLLRADR